MLVRREEGDSSDSGNDEDAALVADGRMLRRTMELGTGLPTSGSLLATLGSGPESQTANLTPGGGYSIEARVWRVSF